MARLRKYWLAGLVLLLLFLDWAAADDITTGNEPDYFWEYFILVISIPVFGLIGAQLVIGWWRAKRQR